MEGELNTEPLTSQTVPIDFGETQKPSPYGQLVSNSSLFGTIDLCSQKFSVGRDPGCSLVINAKKLPTPMLLQISKVHFVLEKDIEDPFSPTYIIDHSTNGTCVNGNQLGKNIRSILMHGDAISMAASKNLVLYRAFNCNVPNEIKSEALKKRYHFGRMLGSGSFGTVYLLHDTITCQPYALKIVNKVRISVQPYSRSSFNNEANIMNSLSHPCVLQMYEFFNEPNSFCMLLEYMEGSDLLTRILDNGCLQENVAQFFFYQLCHAIDYLHDQDIIHRDLKPDNILLKDSSVYTLLKVSDFGSSKFLDDNMYMHTICGTPEYIAPEMLEQVSRKGYTNKIDIWSLGVILYTMLSGLLPFGRRDSMTDIDQITHGDFTMSQPVWRTVKSCRVKKLIYDILNVDPCDRPSIKTLLGSKWFHNSEDVRRARHIMNLPVNSFHDLP
ncbi:ovarian-specific serine/threonine-protein kinase Lok-like [Anopheles marshallii]|uniref:ovarian-specific serine/threonine-protein kinase Lok-like n=1 Tax=Anopheles marshallii TaxID=1521116 RepID=UPI00237BB193|nr:ovarian-specific serine/threonine-protein kinase Lok-like [Anopheles marshallii]